MKKLAKIRVVVSQAMLLFLITTLSCSTLNPKDIETDKVVKIYIQELIDGSNGTVTWEDINQNVFIKIEKFEENTKAVGRCHYQPIFIKKITLNKDWWNNRYVTQHERFQVIAHELGHCFLNRPHTQPTDKEDVSSPSAYLENQAFKNGLITKIPDLPDGCEGSIMHPYTLSDYCIVTHYTYYMDELFGRIKFYTPTKKEPQWILKHY